jgi:DNA invertase Pin-like site-specific DNA recombinase
MNVIGYVRVSTEDQAREGVSLDAQEERLRAYCQAKAWTLVAVVRDEGKSAKDTNRPGLQRLLAELPKRRRGWDALVVTKLDRLTRSVRDLGELTAAFRRAKVAFVSLDESVDTGSAAGELFLNVVASISQWERRAIGERTASAMAHLKAKGQRVSRQAAYGFRLAAGGRVVVDQGEQAIRRQIVALRAAGTSLRAISRQLAERGILARNGRAFAPQTLAQIVSQGPLTDSAVA